MEPPKDENNDDDEDDLGLDTTNHQFKLVGWILQDIMEKKGVNLKAALRVL